MGLLGRLYYTRKGEAMKKKTTPYWTAVIKEARRRKKKGLVPFVSPVRNKAASWVTCACGKQDPRIPINHGPVDTRLYSLGCSFYGAVEEQRIDSAEKILHKIERRAAEILRGLA
jgi:hypothetical protein